MMMMNPYHFTQLKESKANIHLLPRIVYFYINIDGNYKICVFISGGSMFNRQSVKMRIRLDSDGSEEKDLSDTLQTSDISLATKEIKRIINKVINFLIKGNESSRTSEI